MSYKAKADEFIKHAEGFSAKAYWDVNKYAIGYGFRDGVYKGQTMTKEQADARLSKETEKYSSAVDRLVTNPQATEDQKAALTAFAYNAGTGALATSTLLKKFNAGDVEGAAAEFGRWTTAGGKFNAGLAKRRSEEKNMFLGKTTKDTKTEVYMQANISSVPIGQNSNLTSILGELRALKSRLSGSGDDWNVGAWTERLRQEGTGA